jgi:hypothetical protein
MKKLQEKFRNGRLRFKTFLYCLIRDIAVGIQKGYRMDGMGSIHIWVKTFSSFPWCPDQLFGPRSLLYNRYWKRFPRGKETRT